MGVINASRHLPGDVVRPENIYEARNWKCSKHDTREVFRILIGETDSMGSETTEMCAECYAKYELELAEEALKKTEPGYVDPNAMECEYCQSTDDVRPCRDPDEGMSGPVYYHCKTCRKETAEYNNR